MKSWLNSVSCLNLDSSLEKFNRKTTDSVLSVATDGSTLPLFLQDQGSFGGTRELLERVQVRQILSAGILKSEISFILFTFF